MLGLAKLLRRNAGEIDGQKNICSLILQYNFTRLRLKLDNLKEAFSALPVPDAKFQGLNRTI